MTGRPTFGLLIPCRNGAAYLPRLFASAAAQTRAFDEVWLFDDGSQDGSRELAAGFGAHVLHSEESIGPSAARNRLMRACPCDWLHFHDADDTMHPRYLERTSAQLSPDIGLVICDMLWVEEASGRVDNHWRYDALELARHPLSSLLRNTVGGINGLYRRCELLAVDGFNESLRFWEDLDLNLRLAQRGTRAAVVNEDLVTAYRRAASYSNSNLGEVWRVKLGLMEGLLAPASETLRETIALEAETIADRLARLGCWTDIAAALSLARRAGANPPTTRSHALRALKLILPPTWTFWLQFRLRRQQTR